MLLRPGVDVKGGQQLCTNDKTGSNTDENRKAHYLFLTDPEEETARFQCVREKEREREKSEEKSQYRLICRAY